MRRLQRDQRSDQHSGAGEQHEGCGDLCHREDPLRRLVLPVIRTLPLARLMPFEASADAGAGQTPNHRATMASAAPTQSMLLSTVRSRARTEKREA